ncbi:MAG: DEAD/DEAH box helicase [Proteobacteria bacterium]|nr:DEAD/DEAH box helicase [Pseudomonadota bacterium]
MAFRTYGRLRLGSTHWLMEGVEPHVAIKLKQLFPRIPKHQTGSFAFPADQPTAADLDWFCSRYPMEMPEGQAQILRAGREAYEQTLAEMERILSPGYVPPAYTGLRDGQVLRPYQAQAIEVLRRRRGLLLGDDIGLGKTYTAGGFALLVEARPAVIVVQTHLPEQWREKLEAFTTLRMHEVKSRKAYSLPDSADVLIFKYTQLIGWVDVFQRAGFKSVTYDEVQELRTGTASDKGNAARVLSDNVEYRLGLSATPIYNYGGEIWNIMQCIDPDVLGKSEEFHREWCSALGNGKWGVTDPEALGTYLREQHVFLRRTKRDVGQQMPAVNPLVERVESDPEAMANIEVLARKLALATTQGSFVERGQAARELDMRVRHATGVGKARHVASFVRVLLEGGERILMAGWHREVYDIWLKELAEFNPVLYTGSESPKQKVAAKAAFMDGTSKIMLMSLRSGAGLDDLQRVCSTAVFGELDWSPKVHEQFIGRLDREGQTEQVTAIYLNSDDGSDPPMVALLGLKASQSSGIVDPGREFEAVTADYSRVKALAKQFLDRKQHKLLDDPAMTCISLDEGALNETPQSPDAAPAQLALIA